MRRLGRCVRWLAARLDGAGCAAALSACATGACGSASGHGGAAGGASPPSADGDAARGRGRRMRRPRQAARTEPALAATTPAPRRRRRRGTLRRRSGADKMLPPCTPRPSGAAEAPQAEARPRRRQNPAPSDRRRRAPADAVVDAQVGEVGASLGSILGKDVTSPKGEDLGRVVDVLADAEGRVRVAIIDFGGFLGVGTRRIAVDWPLLRFDPNARRQAAHPERGSTEAAVGAGIQLQRAASAHAAGRGPMLQTPAKQRSEPPTRGRQDGGAGSFAPRLRRAADSTGSTCSSPTSKPASAPSSRCISAGKAGRRPPSAWRSP